MRKMNLIKKIAVTGTVAALGVSMLAGTVIAGSFQTDEKGKWYKEDDGSYPKSTWKWIDSDGNGEYECYAFDENGYLYVSTTTPDNYTTDENGAWIKDGALQTRKSGDDLSDLAISTGSASVSVSGSNTKASGTSSSGAKEAKTVELKTPTVLTSKNVGSDQIVMQAYVVKRESNEDSGPDMSQTSYDTNGPGVPEGYSSDSVSPLTDTSTQNVKGPDGTVDSGADE